jgi:hypothetical protein
MRFKEIILERMDISWIRPWIASAVSKIGSYKNDLDWFEKFFKNLNSSKELKTWQKNNISHPVKINARLLDRPDLSYAVLNAEHQMDEALKHIITVEINVSKAPSDEIKTKAFIDRLSSVLIHELNHTHQRDQQIKKSKDPEDIFDLETTIWKKAPPDALTKRDQYYIYILDNMEKDAWISQIASEIHNVLGDDSIKYLNSILRQAQLQDYVTIKSKIINIPNLKTLYDALNYYGSYLKVSKETAWQKVKKELYGYLSRYGK